MLGMWRKPTAALPHATAPLSVSAGQQATIRTGQATQRGGESRAKQAHSQFSCIGENKTRNLGWQSSLSFSSAGRESSGWPSGSTPTTKRFQIKVPACWHMFFLAGQEETDSGCDFSRFGSRPQDVLLHRVQGRPQNCLQALCQVPLGAFWKGET